MRKDDIYDCVIVGAGPAGLQLGYMLQELGRDFIVLERSTPGSFFKTFPRHEKLLSINKVYTRELDEERRLRWDWNSLVTLKPHKNMASRTNKYFPKSKDLVEYLQDFSELVKESIVAQTNVVKVAKDEGFFVVETECNRTFVSKVVVVATGLFQPVVPEIEGISLTEGYSNFDVNPETYQNQRVLIIGKGNSAFETACSLIEHAANIHMVSPSPVKMAWWSHFVGHLRAVNNSFLDTDALKSQNFWLNGRILQIEKLDGRFRVVILDTDSNAPFTIVYDRIIMCTGFRFDPSILSDNCAPNCLDNGLPKLTSSWESQNVPNLYFAGTLTQSNDYKVSSSAFIHGFRHNAIALASIINEKFFAEPLPSKSYPKTLQSLISICTERIHKSAAIWHQFGLLCDAIIIRGDAIQLLKGFPVRFILEHPDYRELSFFVVTLNYLTPIEESERKKFSKRPTLHPIIEYYAKGQKLDEVHMYESIEAEWIDRADVEQIEEFFVRNNLIDDDCVVSVVN